MAYIQYRPIIEKRSVVVDEGEMMTPRYNAFTQPTSLAALLFLLLLISWLSYGGRLNTRAVGIQWGSNPVTLTSEPRVVAPVSAVTLEPVAPVQPVVTATRPVAQRAMPQMDEMADVPGLRRATTIAQPQIYPESEPTRVTSGMVPASVAPKAATTQRATPTQQAGQKQTSIVRSAQTGARAPDPNIIGYSLILPNTVALRRSPTVSAATVLTLRRDQMVAVLNESDLDDQGEVWARVAVETTNGTKHGWVNRRVLSY